MVKRVLALAAVALFATAGVARAQDPSYPTPGNSLTADDTTVAPGESMVLGVQICQPGSSATFRLESAVLGTATANSSGVATLTATIPSNTSPGSHTIEATCTGTNGQPLTQVLSFTVTGGATGGLPTTGSANTTPMTQVAIAAIAAGGLLVLLANKRRTAKADTRETAGV